MKEKEMEVATVKETLSAEEAREAGLRQARQELLSRCGPEARITSENILHEQKENGKVMLTVLFEVEQSIAVERPIVQAPAG
jgi:similar to stage IV sporulation protein